MRRLLGLVAIFVVGGIVVGCSPEGEAVNDKPTREGEQKVEVKEGGGGLSGAPVPSPNPPGGGG